MTDTKLSSAVLEALSIGNLPGMQWKHDDDLCDCTYQRIGMWTNPYLAETQEIRLCCVWAKLGEMFPDFVRTVPAYWNENEQQWDTEPQKWNGEDAMPKAIWYRHLARKLGVTITEVRAEYSEKDHLRPKGCQRVPIFLPYDGGWALVNWEI